LLSFEVRIEVAQGLLESRNAGVRKQRKNWLKTELAQDANEWCPLEYNIFVFDEPQSQALMLLERLFGSLVRSE
jgi:hypothetical protein